VLLSAGRAALCHCLQVGQYCVTVCRYGSAVLLSAGRAALCYSLQYEYLNCNIGTVTTKSKLFTIA
jgi:hypothetical protein